MAKPEISLTLDDDSAGISSPDTQYTSRIKEIGDQLSVATNLGETLINLKDDICELFGAERVTVFVIDGVKRELVSHFKSGK